MADEQMKPPYSRERIIPKNLDWASLERLDGDDLETHYRHILTELGKNTRYVDVKGDAYVGLLEKNAAEGGAGQHFTPRSTDRCNCGRDSSSAEGDHS
jgi:type I restriction enzyme M protein